MDYMHADHYAHTDHYSHGHGGDSHFSHISHPYMTGGVDYNPNASFDGHSDHSSHNSLQAPRGGDQSHGPYSSFSPYTGLRMSDDGHASPIPRSASPNTREPSYHNLPAYQEAPLSHYPDHSGVDDSFGPRNRQVDEERKENVGASAYTPQTKASEERRLLEDATAETNPLEPVPKKAKHSDSAKKTTVQQTLDYFFVRQ